MTARDFCYWLQGYFEVTGDRYDELSPDRVEVVKKHLALVFAHDLDPQAGGPGEQAKLNHLHHPGGDARPRC